METLGIIETLIRVYIEIFLGFAETQRFIVIRI